jgi:hypothetical protein
MSGLEVVGLALGVLPVIFGEPDGSRAASLAWITNRWKVIRNIYRKDGILAVLLFIVLPDSSITMERIGKVLTGTDAELLEFRQSLSSNMNMVAITVSFQLQSPVNMSCARLTCMFYAGRHCSPGRHHGLIP